MSIKRKTIICIDDNPRILEVFRTVLSNQETEVITATNMHESWRVISNQEPDLIILDMFLSGTDGWKLYEMLKASKELRQIPLILLSVTGRSGHQLKENINTINPEHRKKDRILEKPLRKTELFINVKEVLNQETEDLTSESQNTSSLNKIPQHRTQSLWSTGVDRRGSGFALLGESDHKVETSQAKIYVSAIKTTFLSLVNIPLIPLGSYRVTIGEITEGNVFKKYTHYNYKAKQSLHILQIGEVYGLAILCFLGFPISLQLAEFVPQLLSPIIAKPTPELRWLSLLILSSFFLLWLYVSIKMAHFVAQRRRNQVINDYRKGLKKSLKN